MSNDDVGWELDVVAKEVTGNKNMKGGSEGPCDTTFFELLNGVSLIYTRAYICVQSIVSACIVYTYTYT